jgi:hypothetical protein
MGSCAYFLKAVFKDEKEAREVAVKLNEFFTEAAAAYEFYHNPAIYPRKWPAMRKEYAKKFPLMIEYLKDAGEWKNEYLSNIDFGQQNDNEVIVNGPEVWWQDYEVGHLTSWGPLCSFLKKKYNAVKVVCDTEEDGCAGLDSLDAYEWEEIVQAILKHKEALPLLMNLHEDLDLLISNTLQR